MIGYFEDMHVGQQTDLGEHTFTEEEIIKFAKKYDPQPFHIDVEKARRSHFGNLIASGWHTASICIKLMVTTHKNALKVSHPLNFECMFTAVTVSLTRPWLKMTRHALRANML